ncbi:MAG: alpha/beta hydrolase [Aeromicrobium sp.]|uniref:lipase family alpha/beta hydrolase n=1 Tax=Aeromicrobium sp. TaxID=1871063 RepID=UPI0039E35960
MSVLSLLRPGPLGLACEIAGLPVQFAKLAAGLGDLARECPRGDGHMILVLPGLTATDHSTWPMRHFLDSLGYRTAGWELGWNMGITPSGEARLEAHVERLAADGPITVLGWSLGGAYAREIARRRPECVRDVITMGTPIRNRKGTGWIVWWLRLLRPSMAEDLTPEGVERFAQPLSQPTTALYSPRDGVLSGWSCRVREEDEGPMARNVQVDATHLGMGFDLGVLRVLAETLAEHNALAEEVVAG